MADLPSNHIKQQEALLLNTYSIPIKSEAVIYSGYKITHRQLKKQQQNEQQEVRKHKQKCKKGRIIGNFITKTQNQQQDSKNLALISKLKSIVIKKQSTFKQVHTKAQLLHDIFALIDRNLRLISFQSENGDFKKYYPAKPTKVYEFLDKDQQLKYRQRNIVAQAFCIIDHGHIPVLNYMQEKGLHIQLSDTRYKSSIEGVVIEGYRQLQRFLYSQCKINIMAIPRNQIKKIRGIMFNCRLTLNEEQWLTFLNFIRVLYGFSDACIVKSVAIKLYINILSILRERLKKFPVKNTQNTGKRKGISKNYFHSHQSQKLRQIWIPEHEKQLLRAYKQIQSFQQLKYHFQSTFPQNKQYFTRLALQGRFHHIIRVYLKKFKKLVEQKYENQLQLMKLDDKIVKKILAAPSGIEVRLKLIDVFHKPQIQQSKLFQLVHILKNFVKSQGQQIEDQMPVSENKLLHRNKGKINRQNTYKNLLSYQQNESSFYISQQFDLNQQYQTIHHLNSSKQYINEYQAQQKDGKNQIRNKKSSLTYVSSKSN